MSEVIQKNISARQNFVRLEIQSSYRELRDELKSENIGFKFVIRDAKSNRGDASRKWFEIIAVKNSEFARLFQILNREL